MLCRRVKSVLKIRSIVRGILQKIIKGKSEARCEAVKELVVSQGAKSETDKDNERQQTRKAN